MVSQLRPLRYQSAMTLEAGKFRQREFLARGGKAAFGLLPSQAVKILVAAQEEFIADYGG